MRTSLIVTDSAQVLADGKILAVGMYTDRVLQMASEGNLQPTADMPFGMASLTLVLTIMDLVPGQHEVQLSLKDPNGKEYAAKLPARLLVIRPGGSANIVMQFVPFIVPSFGRFELEASVAGQVGRESFEVRRAEPEFVPPRVAQHLTQVTQTTRELPKARKRSMSEKQPKQRSKSTKAA